MRDSFNAVFVEGDAVGSLMFFGRGAGGSPTASAVLGDVVDAAINLVKHTHGSLGSFSRARIRPIDETSAEYLLNLEVDDRPGVLHAVTGVFARHDVSIRAAEQEGIGPEARLVFITHEARESAVQATVRELRDLDVGAPRRQPAARDRCRVKYVSTRGTAPVLGFADVLLAGLANDGGLYVPETWPVLPPAIEGATYAERAAQVMAPFVDGDCGLDDATLLRLCRSAYGTFRHPAVVPLVQTRRPPLRARAVPRADAGVQGRRPAARRPAVRPRARRSRSTSDHRRGDERRHRARRRSTACAAAPTSTS